MTSLSVAVQHHPERGALLAALLEGLGGAVDVVTDPDPYALKRSPWRTYRYALETTPTGATHRLVVQDDAVPCRNFHDAVRNAVAARPDNPIVLCVCGEPSQSAERLHQAAHRGEQWCILDPALWVPAIAVIWPVRLIAPALAWVDEQEWPPTFTADDEIIGRIMREQGETVLATVPSLVEHTDMDESLVGQRARHGLDPGRVTTCPPADDCDPAQIDWS